MDRMEVSAFYFDLRKEIFCSYFLLCRK